MIRQFTFPQATEVPRGPAPSARRASASVGGSIGA